MSYTTNINQIDSQLKSVFSEVKIDNSDFRALNIRCTNSIKEGVNEELEMRIFVTQKNLNGINPILEWGYYTDPTNLDNNIKFQTPIQSISVVVNDILKNNRLNENYLNNLNKVELIREQKEKEELIIEDISNINQTYTLSENHLQINIEKLTKFLDDKYNLVVDDILIEHRDVNSGRFRSSAGNFNNTPVMGDESEISLINISSKSMNGQIPPSLWLKLENELRKLPMLEDVNSSTYSYSCTFNFSTKLFVELN